MSDDYTRLFLDEAAELAKGLPVRHHRRDGRRPCGGPRRRWAPVHPRRRRWRGPRLDAVNDFRKICHFEAYTPTDNVSELTARINDDGWETAYSAWLRGSRISGKDAVLVFSVGGGSREHNVSVNLVTALDARPRGGGAKIYGIIGKEEGETNKVADACVVVPALPERRTPQVEAFQAVVWHLIVSHPRLTAQAGKWESVEATPATS